MLKTKKTVFLLLILFVALTVTACDTGNSGNDTGNDDALIWDFHSGSDFSFDYPAEWTITSNQEQLNSLEYIYGDIYSSGVITGPSSEFKKLFMVISLDVEDYVDYPINNADLNDFVNSFHQSHIETSDAVLKEESYLTIDGNPAIELIYEYPRDKASYIATYEGYKFYLIAYGSEKAEYNNMLSLFRKMRESVRLY